MYLLYLDESGNIGDSTQCHYVLAGVSVFERQGHWIEQEMNQIANRFASDGLTVELHGSPMRSGRGIWRQFSLQERRTAIEDCLKMIAKKSRKADVRLFGVVIKKSLILNKDPVEYVFEQVTSRFDHYLRRLYLRRNPQRGLIVLDKSADEKRIQTLAREFKISGHTWGRTKNFAEVPVFLDSRASRIIQLADLVAYAMFRHYEHSDSGCFNIIRNYFDSDGGVVHGLHEYI